MKYIQKNRKTIVIYLLIALLILGSAAVVWSVYHASQNGHQKATDTTESHSTSSKSQQNSKTDTEQNANPKSPVNNESMSDKDEKSLTAYITAANQTNETLQIRTLIEDLGNEGSCTLSLTKGSVSISRTSEIQPLSSLSTCKGFDLPLSELAPGEWSLAIDILISSRKTSIIKNITIQ